MMSFSPGVYTEFLKIIFQLGTMWQVEIFLGVGSCAVNIWEPLTHSLKREQVHLGGLALGIWLSDVKKNTTKNDEF